MKTWSFFRKWKYTAAAAAILLLTLLAAGSAAADTRKSQTIRCEDSFTVTYKEGYSFSLNAKSNTSRSYKSGNPSVAVVSSSGVVTVKGYGVTTITIKAKATSKFLSAKKDVAVYVKPAAPSKPVLKSGKAGEFVVTWKKDPMVSGYQIQYSVNKNFSGSKKLKVAGSSTTTKTISIDQPGALVYVRLQSYKKISGRNLFGPFGKADSVTVLRFMSQNLSANPSPVVVKAGQSRKLSISGAKTSLTFTSSDTATATVDSSGMVTGRKAGYAVVTVKAKATSKYYSAVLKVPVTVTGNPVSETQMKNALSSKGNVALWYCADYDGDGLKEGFAITMDSQKNIQSVWFVDSYGKVTELLKSTSSTFLGFPVLNSNGTAYCYYQILGKGYYYVNYNVSGTTWGDKAMLFGVKNGKAYELDLSRKISGFFMDPDGTLYTIRHYLDPYHVYMKVRLNYDRNTNQFVLGEDLGKLYG